MPDIEASDTSESAGSSVEGEESGGAATSGNTSSAEATDWKAKAKELEKALAKATGKAGATQATLTEQLTTQTNRAQSAETKVADLTKQIQQLHVLQDVLEKAPEKSRGAVKLAAKGILPEVDLSDPSKAVETVISKITADAPDLFAAKKNPVEHMPHNQGDSKGRAGFAFTRDGKRLI